MAMEIELKLRLPRTQARRLLAHPLLSGERSRKLRLFNTYYDTPELDLRRRGIALRLRRKGWAVWLMTVKCGAGGAGGLAQRSEWEAPAQPGEFDFSIVTDSTLRDFLEAHLARLQAVFSTEFTRTAWTLTRADSLIEVALDQGRISAAAPAGSLAPESAALCEVELELLAGTSPDALFDLAIELAADLHLHPEILSKAERGYALAEGSLADPVKAFDSSLAKSMAPVEAFRAVATLCLTQLQRNEAGVIAGENPEHVHQARVAIRRLSSAFRLFAPVLAADFIAVYSPRWRKLAGLLGSARDWDVFLGETLAPLEDAFPGDADLALLRRRGDETRNKAQQAAGLALAQPEYSQLLLAFSAALFREEAPTIASAEQQGATGLRKFARRRLEKRARAIERLANDHGKMNAERRHQLRIEFKKLRYAIEFFAPIFSRKRLRRYQESLSTIQDLLGTLNDQVTASRLIEELHPKGEPNLLTRGWIAGRSQILVGALNDELNRFLSRAKPWR